MTAEERNQRLSEVFDAMEAGEATIDDWRDAIFPTKVSEVFCIILYLHLNLFVLLPKC